MNEHHTAQNACRTVFRVTVACSLIFAFGAKAGLTQPDTVSCPSVFHSVSITNDATQCQQFETQVPAAMVYYTKQQPQDVIAFYQDGMSSLTMHPPINQRTLLTSDANHTRIVVSPDNAGSQVDILVTPSK